MPGVLFLVCCYVLFGTAASLPPGSSGIEAWGGLRITRTAGESSPDDHHHHDEEATGEAHGQTEVRTASVLCYLSSASYDMYHLCMIISRLPWTSNVKQFTFVFV